MQAEIISELEGHILECVRDSNGNHVIQEWADPILLQSIVASFTGKVGCVVLRYNNYYYADYFSRILVV